MRSRLKKMFMLIIAVTGWFAILLQLYLLLSVKNEIGFLGKLVNFISYFTVLTNILVAISLTETLFNPSWGLGKFFLRPAASGALAVYILIVGIVYFLALRQLWDPMGWQFIADALLHYTIPILYTLYWLIFVPKGRLRWYYCTVWLVYPFLYFCYLLLRGAYSGTYAYPFINVNELGYAAVLTNAAEMLAAFIVTSLLVIGIDKLISPGKLQKIP